MGYGARPLLISASMDSTIRLWDVTSQMQIEALQYKESQVNSMCITPDGAQFLIGAWQNLRIYDLNCLTNAGLHNSTVHEKNITTVGFQAEGAWMYTGGEDCMAKIWDMRINQLNCQRIFQVNTPIHSIALHPNQVELLIADSTGAIYLWDLRSDRDDTLPTEVDVSEYIVHMDIDRLGRQCAAVSNRGNLFLWEINQKCGLAVQHDTNAESPKQPDAAPDNELSKGFSRDFKAEYSLTDTDLPPIATPPSAEIESRLKPMKVEITSTVSMPIDLVSNAKYRTKLRAHKAFSLKCRYRPDGLAIATTSADQTTKLWSVNDYNLLKTYSVPGSKWVWDCAFTNDSAYMLTASSDGIIRMWELASGSFVRSYQGHSMGITCMAFKDFT